MEREKQPRGNREEATREEVTEASRTAGKMKSLCKTVCEEFIGEELFAIRKAIKHNSPRKRCKQSPGRRVCVWKEKRYL